MLLKKIADYYLATLKLGALIKFYNSKVGCGVGGLLHQITQHNFNRIVCIEEHVKTIPYIEVINFDFHKIFATIEYTYT